MIDELIVLGAMIISVSVLAAFGWDNHLRRKEQRSRARVKAEYLDIAKRRSDQILREPD